MARPVTVGVLALLVFASLTPALVARAQDGTSPAPADWVHELWAGISPPLQGWGYASTNITNPGPDIIVSPGALVQLTLNSIDFGHRFHLDLDGDNVSEVGEPESATFFPSPTGTGYSFSAPLSPGAWWYRCVPHTWTAMRGRFIVSGVAANQPPTITLSNPDGVAVNQWSGNSLHRLTWDLFDPDNLPSQLNVYLNYTYNGGADGGTIVGPPTLPAGSLAYDWTVPAIDATDVHVLATVVDPGGAQGMDDRLIPIIDSTLPTVTATDPMDGETSVDPASPINITFSESMQTAATEGAISLNPPVALTFTWVGNTLVAQPTSPLADGTTYTTTVSTAARDDSNPGNALAAPYLWVFRTAGAGPSVTVSSPTATSRWTGGSVHAVAWTATDPVDPPDALTVWVNYSETGSPPWSPVIGPVAGNLTTFDWTAPVADTSAARLNIVAANSFGETTSVLSAAFTLDSTPPTVATSTPDQGATNVPITANMIVTFSEPMNKVATGDATVVALFDVDLTTWVPLAPSWDGPGVVLTGDPVAVLRPNGNYSLFVNASARDAADPGLTMTAAYSADFRTSAVADATPPVIASATATPDPQFSGLVVNVTAIVTDNVGLAPVAVNVSQPDGTPLNLTMAAGLGNAWSVEHAWPQVGAHSFVVWAFDTSGNFASRPGSFTIVAADTTPPEIAHTSPAGLFRIGTGTGILIEATVTDAGSGVSVVKIDYVDVNGQHSNSTMNLIGADTYRFAIPMPNEPGDITYFIYAEDAAGNTNLTALFTLTVEGAAGFDATLLVALVLVAVVALVAVALLLRRRRKKGAEPPPGPETP